MTKKKSATKSRSAPEAAPAHDVAAETTQPFLDEPFPIDAATQKVQDALNNDHDALDHEVTALDREIAEFDPMTCDDPLGTVQSFSCRRIALIKRDIGLRQRLGDYLTRIEPQRHAAVSEAIEAKERVIAAAAKRISKATGRRVVAYGEAVTSKDQLPYSRVMEAPEVAEAHAEIERLKAADTRNRQQANAKAIEEQSKRLRTICQRAMLDPHGSFLASGRR